jgi:shikimate 5-dehydrogenase
MEMNDIQLKDKHCSILGAGGAARAVAYSLIKAGVKSIFIQNRTQENADKLINWINSIYPDNSSYETAEVIINCTPLGMWPDTESIPNIKIDSEQVWADTIYNPL